MAKRSKSDIEAAALRLGAKATIADKRYNTSRVKVPQEEAAKRKKSYEAAPAPAAPAPAPAAPAPAPASSPAPIVHVEMDNESVANAIIESSKTTNMFIAELKRQMSEIQQQAAEPIREWEIEFLERDERGWTKRVRVFAPQFVKKTLN